MARIRTIKPEFFTSLTVASLPLEARLTFIGLWTHVDDEGRCVDDARLVKAAVWPLDDRISADVERDLQALSESSLITRYKVGARSFLVITNWREHQRINRPTKSKLPSPPAAKATPPASSDETPPRAETPGQTVPEPPTREPSPQSHAHLSEDSSQERNREQGTGNREVPPTAGRELAPVAPPETTEALIAEWIDHCNKRPPGSVIGQAGKHVKQMLAEGIAAADIRRGLAAWHTKSLHPSSLPSVVNEAMNASPIRSAGVVRRSTTDDRVNAALALAAEFDAQEVA